MLCLRVLCCECAGAHPERLCELLRCRECRVRAAVDGGSSLRARELVVKVEVMRDLGQRASTRRTHVRGMQDYLKCCKTRGISGLPATVFDLECYVVWAVHERVPRLDTSSIRTNLSGVSAWHKDVQTVVGVALLNPRRTTAVRTLLKIADENFKLASKAMGCLSYAEWSGVLARGFPDSRSGRHRALLFVLCTVCPLRPAAAAQLVIVYHVGADGLIVYGADSQVEVVRRSADWPSPYLLIHLGRNNARADKNVDAMHTRSIPVPSEMLGCQPVEMLERYLAVERPPSGGLLLSAPLGAVGFRTTAYTLACKAVKEAYELAHPGMLAISNLAIGGSTPRKSVTQWLWEAGHSKRAISDLGGWRSKKEGVDYYFTTSRVQMLTIKANLNPAAPLHPDRPW